MRTRWDNIVAFTVVIVVLVLLLKVTSPLRSIWRHITALGRHNGDPFIGLLALGIICLTVVAIFRVISNGRR
jgi:uncharacterized membrane protein YqhA